jgi:transcriptional regulator with XRE-family HTH domain
MTPFNKIIAEALRRRLHPNTGLHSDQLAYALGMNGDTVRAWLRGHNTPNGEAVSELLRFFYASGDYGFAVELFGDAVTPLTKRARLREAVEAIERAKEALEAVA